MQPSGIDDLSAFVVAGRTCTRSSRASVSYSFVASSHEQTCVVRMKLSSIRAHANRPDEREEIERHEVGP